MYVVTSILYLWEAGLSGHGDRWMPIPLNKTVHGIESNGFGFLEERKGFVDGISEQSSSLLHLTVSVGWDITKICFVDLSSLTVLQPVHQHPEYSEATRHYTRITAAMQSLCIGFDFQSYHHVSSE